jgi:hypothetical protein
VRRADDVFFFTLIDFLAQIFFGLLLYVVGQAALAQKQTSKADVVAQAEELESATGFSNLAELTDYLTRLAPATEWKGVADFFSERGGLVKARDTLGVVARAGGPEKLAEAPDKLRKYEEGTGKPPCLFDVVNDRKVPRPLATVVATDDTIRFPASTPDLRSSWGCWGVASNRSGSWASTTSAPRFSRSSASTSSSPRRSERARRRPGPAATRPQAGRAVGSHRGAVAPRGGAGIGGGTVPPRERSSTRSWRGSPGGRRARRRRAKRGTSSRRAAPPPSGKAKRSDGKGR